MTPVAGAGGERVSKKKKGKAVEGGGGDGCGGEADWGRKPEVTMACSLRRKLVVGWMRTEVGLV